ncbi:MAG: hypothetical protein J07HN4v3_00628 [Halonotius sp. J07HN4]|nr:MAG: hypothetical protein J07HN4v3_00628 [Halonotius sp. J07HN4]
MQLVHWPESGGGSQVLASDIEIADSFLQQARGLMFRRSLGDDSALVFQFNSEAKRDVHMLFVPFAIDALWVVNNEVVATKQLKPWIGLGRAGADTLIEVPAGTADEVAAGDRVALSE